MANDTMEYRGERFDGEDSRVRRFRRSTQNVLERGKERARRLAAGAHEQLDGVSRTASSLVDTREKRNAAYTVIALTFIVGFVSGMCVGNARD